MSEERDHHRFNASHPPPPAHAEGAHAGHGHSHGLGAHGTATAQHRRRLVIVVCITLSVFVVQVVGALIANSLALLADAGHMLMDATGVLIALIASYIAARPETSRRTFGYMRAEVLAALINGVVLGVIAVVVLVEAIRRFGTDVEVHSGPMLVAAVIGAVANLVSLMVLRPGQKESLNVRGAYLEVLGDLLGSVAVIVAAVVIMVTGWTHADAVASIAIAVLIFPRAVSLLRDVVNVLMESTPEGVDLDETREHIRSVPGVVEVHDTHAWTITSGVHAFSAHVVVEPTRIAEHGLEDILDELGACLGEHFDTAHSTFQIEPASHAEHETAVHR